EKHDGNALKAPQLVDQLVRSDTANNLLRVFRLRETLKELAKAGRGQPSVRRVHVIGAGTMGGDIAAWCALKGLTVTLQDQDRERIAQAQGRAATLFARKTRNARDAQAAADRMAPDPRGDGIRHADLVIEAITENLEAKRSLYAQIEPQMQPGAVLATNTSSLSLQALGSGLNTADRFVGLHFFNPVARMPLVEVVETGSVSASVKHIAYTFAGAIDKLPLPVQDTPGFLVNAVLAPYMLEAMRCVVEGIRPETLDAAMLKFGMPMGPIELIDTVGLDIARDAGLQLTEQTRLPACLEHHLDRNELGRKSGQGFYRWQNGKAIRQDAGAIPPDLAIRLITPLI